MNTLSQTFRSKCIQPPVSEAGTPLVAFDRTVSARVGMGFQALVLSLLAILMVGCNARTSAQTTQKSQTTNTISLVPVTTNSASEPLQSASTNNPSPLPAPTPPPTLVLQAETQQIIKLAQAGLIDPVLKAYILRSTNLFQLTSEDIVYLNDVGISSEIIEAMLAHDNTLGVAQPTITVAAAQPNNAPSAAPLVEVTSNLIPNAATVPNAPTVPDAPTVGSPGAPPAQAITVLPPQQPVTQQYFQTSLSPYGNWVNVPGYGLCWQPTVATTVVDWRPYGHSGRWLYSDYGWYWHSDYSWGWAPFHYGRWFRPAGFSWCWIPDTTWGPAWVSWRYSDAYCGWAPLPPAAHWRHGVGFSYHDTHVGSSFGFNLSWDYFTVVSYSRLCERRPFDHHIPRHQAEHFHKNSTVVNIAANRTHTMINHGVPRDRVSKASRSEVPHVSVRDLPRGSGHSNRPDSLTREGSKLVVHRQTPNPNPHPTPSADVPRSSPETRQSRRSDPIGAAPIAPRPAQGPAETGRVRPAPIELSPNRGVNPRLPGRTPAPALRTGQETPFATRATTPAPKISGPPPLEIRQPTPTPAPVPAPSRPVTSAPTIPTAPIARPEPRTPTIPAPNLSKPPVTSARPAIVTAPNPRPIIAVPAPAPAPILRPPVRNLPSPQTVPNRPAIVTTPNPRPIQATPAPAPTPAYRAPIQNNFRQPPSSGDRPAVASNPAPRPASPTPAAPRNPNPNSNPSEKGNSRRDPSQR